MKLYGPIAEYNQQPIFVGKHTIEMSFDFYRSQNGQLGWAKHNNGDQPAINQLPSIYANSATHLDIGQLISEMVRVETKKSLVPKPLEVLLDNEYLVAMILTEIGSSKAP